MRRRDPLLFIEQRPEASATLHTKPRNRPERHTKHGKQVGGATSGATLLIRTKGCLNHTLFVFDTAGPSHAMLSRLSSILTRPFICRGDLARVRDERGSRCVGRRRCSTRLAEVPPRNFSSQFLSRQKFANFRLPAHDYCQKQKVCLNFSLP